MEPDDSLPRLQEPSTRLYPEPVRPSPCLPIPLLEDPFQYYPPIYAWVFQVVPSLMSPHQNRVCTPLLHTCHVTAHLILLDLIKLTIFGEDHRSQSCSLCSFLHSPVASSLVVPYIFLSTLFSNTLGLLSSRNASDQVSHPYKTTGNNIVFYVSSS